MPPENDETLAARGGGEGPDTSSDQTPLVAPSVRLFTHTRERALYVTRNGTILYNVRQRVLLEQRRAREGFYQRHGRVSSDGATAVLAATVSLLIHGYAVPCAAHHGGAMTAHGRGLLFWVFLDRLETAEDLL